MLKRVSRILYNRNNSLDARGKALIVTSLLLLGLIVQGTKEMSPSPIPGDTATRLMITDLKPPPPVNLSAHDPAYGKPERIEVSVVSSGSRQSASHDDPGEELIPQAEKDRLQRIQEASQSEHAPSK